MNHTTALVVSIYFPFQTLTGIILASLFLGERLDFHAGLGGIFLIGGVMMVLWSKRQETRRKQGVILREVGSTELELENLGQVSTELELENLGQEQNLTAIQEET